jgi:hypothetical protein
MKYTSNQQIFGNADTGGNTRQGIVSPLMAHMTSRSMVAQVGDVRSAMTKSVYYGFTSAGVSSVASGKRYYFAPDQTLDNSIITGIEVLVNTTLSRFITSGGQRDTLTLAQQASATLYLCDKDNTVISSVPFTSMVLSAQGGRPAMMYSDNHSWMASFFVFENMAGITSNNGIGIRVSYQPK